MNHYVPDFEMDHDEFTIPTSSTLTRQKAVEDDIKELLWQDGHVIVQSSQTPRSDHQKSPLFKMPSHLPPRQPQDNNTTTTSTNANTNTSNTNASNQLFMGEDEMAAWLHYPLEDLYTDLLYPTSTSQPLTQSSGIADVARPPHPTPPPPPRPPVPPPQPAAPRNFPLFSRLGGRAPEAPVSSRVDSNDTPEPRAVRPLVSVAPPAVAKITGEISPAVSRSRPVAGGGGGGKLREGGGSGDMTVTSSPSGSGGGTDTVREGEDRKRKARENDEVVTATATATATTATEYQTEDVELESADEKKHSRGSSAAKRSRAAEVHNLSERRRRDRINEKMKALQELIPRCNKSDKASMLDEAIEYLKSLQMQVQMMSMGCGMVPMMYPGMQQQYMPPMGMGLGLGLGMGMGMGMDMGMSRPVVPFPSAVPGSAMPAAPAGSVLPTNSGTPVAGPPLAPRLPVPPFPMPPVPAPAVSMMQPSNQADSVRGSFPLQSSGLPQTPNMLDPVQQYLALQQMQMQMQMQMQVLQNQALSQSQPGSSKPSTSKSDEEYDDN